MSWEERNCNLWQVSEHTESSKSTQAGRTKENTLSGISSLTTPFLFPAFYTMLLLRRMDSSNKWKQTLWGFSAYLVALLQVKPFLAEVNFFVVVQIPFHGTSLRLEERKKNYPDI